MLTHLQLRDFVIVDHAELDFTAGLTALTGETGAGKSIVVDALAMIAGGRASGDVVRDGAERSEVTAQFAALPQAARDWLDEQAIDHDGEILARRVVGADGRSRAYLNGRLVPLQSLREFMDFLVEIHGQQEFQHLVARDAQRTLVDEHGDARDLARAVAQVHALLRDCRRELGGLRAVAVDLEARRELARHQLAELKAEVTTAADIDALFVERKRVADRGRLAAAAGAALAAAYEADGGSAHDLLGKARASVRGAGGADPALQAVEKLLDEAAINVREAADSLRHYLDALDMDAATAGGNRAARRRARVLGAQAPPPSAGTARAHGRTRARTRGAAEFGNRHRRARAARTRFDRGVSRRGRASRRGAARGRRGARAGDHGLDADARHARRPLRGRRDGHRGRDRPARHGHDRIPGQRKSRPAAEKPREGRLRRRIVAHQPRDPGRGGGEDARRVHGVRRGRCRRRRRDRGDRRPAVARARRSRPSPVRDPPRRRSRARPTANGA